MFLFEAGGCAGLSVDLILYPFDTVKTRLQSEKGFLRSGGFRGIYQGIGSVSVASVPGGMYLTIFSSYLASFFIHTNYVYLKHINTIAEWNSLFNICALFSYLITVSYFHTASLFFCTYDSLKHASGNPNSPMVHMAAASCGEVVRYHVVCQTILQPLQALRRAGRKSLSLFGNSKSINPKEFD